MQLPIIIDDHGDIEFYPSVDQAELDIEPLDAKNAEYLVYDAEGLVLQLGVRAVSVGLGAGEVAAIRETGVAEKRPDELRLKLVDFFSQVLDTPCTGLQLPELVARGVEFFKLNQVTSRQSPNSCCQPEADLDS